MKDQKPILHVLKEIDNGDGTVDMELEITDELIEQYKKITGKKRATRKGIQEFLLKIITDTTESER